MKDPIVGCIIKQVTLTLFMALMNTSNVLKIEVVEADSGHCAMCTCHV